MRDPERIGPFLERLGEFWRRYPDWRFGQLVMNLARDSNGAIGDPWNIEDDEMLARIESWVDEDEMTDEQLQARVKAQMPFLSDGQVARLVRAHRQDA